MIANTQFGEDVMPAVAKAFSSNGQSIASGANPPETQELTDITHRRDGILEPDLSNNQINILVDGVYLCASTVIWASDSGWTTGNIASPNIHKNDKNTTIAPGEVLKVSTGEQKTKTWTVSRFKAGDSVLASVYQDSGSTKSIAAEGTDSRLMVARLGKDFAGSTNP